MFKWLMHRGTAAFERQWNYDASYLHELIDIDPRAAWMFQRATALGKYRKDVPLDALFAAGITAVRSEGLRPVHATRRLDGREDGRRSESAAGSADRDAAHDASRRGAGLAVHARDARPRSVGRSVSR